MPFTTYTSSIIKLKIFWLLAVLFFLGISNTIAQDSLNTVFEDAVKKALVLRPSEFSAVKSIFRKYNRDTILMKRLAKESRLLKYKEGECYALNSLGIIYRNLSLYTKALESHKQAEELAEEANNIELMMFSLNMQGVAYRRMDFIRSALDYHAKALNIANTVETPSYNVKLGIAISQNSMGNIYLSLKQYDLALEQFNNSLTIEKSLNNKLGLAINYHNIGFVKEAEGRLEDALKDYETSLEYSNEINSEVGLVICNNSIVQVYIKQKKFLDALKLSESTLIKALEVGDQFHTVTSYKNLGWVLNELNNLSEAEHYFNIAKNISKKYGFKSSEIEVYKLLSELNIKKGEFQTALQEFKMAMN